jgi:NADH-quinone oxidoreductase subunit H
MISYELAQGISLVSVVLLAGTLSLAQIARQQTHMWYVVPQFFGFAIYVISGIAETNRAPFDLPEAETELVAGFHTEYSSMKWAFYFLGEYANMMVVSGIAITVFLGGWQGPVLPPVVWFLVKLTAFLFFYIWLRATFPRLRYDQLMALGWKVLLPASILNLVVTATVVALW